MSNDKNFKVMSGIVTVKLRTKQAATILMNELEEPIWKHRNKSPMLWSWYINLPKGIEINTSYELAVYPKYLDAPKQNDVPKQHGGWFGSKLKDLAASFAKRSEQIPDEWWLVIREDTAFEPRYIGTILSQYMYEYPDTLVDPDFLVFTSICLANTGAEIIPPHGMTTIVTPAWTTTFSDATVPGMNMEQFIEHLEAQKEIINISRSLA